MSKDKKEKKVEGIKNWKEYKGYNRNFLKDLYLKGRIVGEEEFLKIGSKMGFKPTTLQMKLRRWSREKNLKREKGGNLNFV